MSTKTFDEWLVELDALCEKYGGGKGMVEQTGRECWRTYYDDDYSPDDALREDWSNG